MALAAACAAAVLAAGAALAPAQGQAEGSDVADTPHNLSSTGPGPIRIAGTTGVCIFCHTPHDASPEGPLWNRPDPGTYYRTYESTTLVAQVGQPSGSSRLCLSCHDGTIALTQTYNSRNAAAGTVFITPNDKGYIGTDLSDDHPISFTYDASLAARAGQLRNPADLPAQLPLDANHQLQCTTCHDPHDNRFGNFLRMDNSESLMCQSCHEITGWSASLHATSTASLANATRDHWSNIQATTVRQAACEACHRPHSAGGRQRLMRHQAEEDNCLDCHDGTVAKTNIAAELSKPYGHFVQHYIGLHSPNESPASMPVHVECSDCHNPHRVASSPTATAPYIKPAMLGATGVSSRSATPTEAVYEYQVCFKCHASPTSLSPPEVTRVLPNYDMSQLFSPANPSFHPVEAPGKNPNVPSLIPPLRTTSMIYCTDCHGSDSSTVRGPHGSIYRPLLVRNYQTTDPTTESPQAYALCYGCHDRSSILGDRSFSLHKEHIVDQHTPCSVCHDPHGVSATQAPMNGGTHLINFDSKVVQPSKSTGQGPTYTDLGNLHGSCTLYCHGKDHVDAKYPVQSGS